MRLLFILVTITVLTEAKKRRPMKRKKIEPDSDELPHETDGYSEKFFQVPFGHIFKEGFQPHLKTPVDFLELNNKYPKERYGRVESTDNTKRMSQYEKLRNSTSPKDSLNFGNKEDKGDINTDENEMKQEKKTDLRDRETKTWHDLAANHARNLVKVHRSSSHGTPEGRTKDTKSNLTLVHPDYKTKEQFLSKSSFDIDIKRKTDRHFNWTTCDEFSHKADFHPNDVVNINWVPFYAWSSDELRKNIAVIHRFSIPTVKIVEKYKEEFGIYLNKTLDWSTPKLYLKSNMEMLLLAVGRRGGFEGIPYNEVPHSMKQSKLILPLINLRLKILDPHLAMMFCDYQYATIMAVSGNEPTTIQEVRSKAATLKFQGKGYPVARDLEAERSAARLERYTKLRKEKEKFLEDRFDSDLPIDI